MRFFVNKLTGAGGYCDVGFFYDPATRACVPICKPGYVYDPTVKKCVAMEDELRT